MKKVYFVAGLMWCMSIPLFAQQVRLDVDVSQRGIKISPLHYGLFFEDINYAADGGLYAELIRNRSFEDAETPVHWARVAPSGSAASLSLVETGLLNEVQGKALKLVVSKASPSARAGVSNTGFWGINAVKGRTYTLSFFAKSEDFTGELTASLVSQGGSVTYARTTLDEGLTPEWRKYTCTLVSNGNDAQAMFVLALNAPGTVYLDVVSLFPPTYKDRANGCRPELAQLLEDMKPNFLRFPGGCFVESFSRETTFQWKNTVGPIEERAGHPNHWGYRTSDGMGYHEFLQLSEDLGATPLYVVNVGIWHGGSQDYKDIGFYIQDALDAIEYANGDATTKYGAMRIANGHPEPFKMYLIEIGNENYQDSPWEQSDHYAERYLQFYTAIKEKYPYMQVIGNVQSWGTDNPTWRNSHPVDMLDEHYYRNPAWFGAQYHKYDTYSRAAGKIYVGEYAVTTECGNGNLNAALGEAVYMCGMENNSDVVVMNSYAPIFRNDNEYQWFIDMIHYNSGEYYCTPSYYIQKLFANNIGTRLVKWIETGNELGSASNARVGVGSWSTVVDYDEVSLETLEGDVLFADDFSSEKGWIPGDGNWALGEGYYRQTSTSINCTAIASFEVETSSYVYRVKARKNSGAEGFLILFNYKDTENYCWWNLGGWNNGTHGVEVCRSGMKSTVASVSGTLETGRWYDVRIEVQGERVRCFLDDQLVHEVTIPDPKAVYATASLDESTKELFLKLVNPSSVGTRTTIALKGTGSILEGKATVLSASSGLAENSMNQPENVVPVEHNLSFEGLHFEYEVPPYSANILKVRLSDVQDPVEEVPDPLPAPAVNYSFEEGLATDDVSKYTGSLENGASIVEIGSDKMLFTGETDGYMDLGSEMGKEVFTSLTDFTLSVNVYTEPDNNLAALGNFICCFSTLYPVVFETNRDRVQYLFLGAKDLSYTINNRNYLGQQSAGHSMNLPSARWYNVTYVQEGSTGTLYLDGVVVERNEGITIQPTDMGADFVYNWLGRSCWSGDAYLKNAYLDDFRIYGGAVAENQLGLLLEGLEKKNDAMSLYQTLRVLDLGDLTQVKEDLQLPSSLKGNGIVWSSSHPNVISPEGEVTCPNFGEPDEVVTLTATVMRNGEVQTKEFTALVLSKEEPIAVKEIQAEPALFTLKQVPGGLWIEAVRPVPVSIYSMEGVRICSLNLEAGEECFVALSAGSYVVNDQKVILHAK